jgi:hypothetical protein
MNEFIEFSLHCPAKEGIHATADMLAIEERQLQLLCLKHQRL